MCREFLPSQPAILGIAVAFKFDRKPQTFCLWICVFLEDDLYSMFYLLVNNAELIIVHGRCGGGGESAAGSLRTAVPSCQGLQQETWAHHVCTSLQAGYCDKQATGDTTLRTVPRT